MQEAVKNDLSWSTALFKECVWPIIKPALGGGCLMEMEGRPDAELAQALDMKCGIDGWHIADNSMRGIASRVQIGNKSWDTFTVRMKRDSGAVTEYEKRLHAISNNGGWIYPHITVQAYSRTKTGPIISVGVARTQGIIAFIQSEFHYMRRTSNAEFAVCGWQAMREHGYKVWVHRSYA